MSDWDASDSEPQIVALPNKNTWSDEDADDGIKESWEDSEDEKLKVTVEPKKKIPLAQKIAEREAKEAEEKFKKALAAKTDKDLTPEELRQRKEEQKRLQEESDMQNAADLFGGVTIQESEKIQIAEENSTGSKLSAFSGKNLKTKDDFEQFEKLLSEIILNSKSNKLYSGFVETLVRNVADPLKDVELRKISSSLTAAANEKQRAAKAALKGKSKGAKKSNVRVDADITSTSTAAKAGVLNDDYDDFDDFM